MSGAGHFHIEAPVSPDLLADPADACDLLSAQIAAAACGGTAALIETGPQKIELTYQGPDIAIGFCGGGRLTINDRPLASGNSAILTSGQVLTCVPGRRALWSYLAVASSQTHLTDGTLTVSAAAAKPQNLSQIAPQYSAATVLRVTEGPHFNGLMAASRTALSSWQGTVRAQSSAMGQRLRGPELSFATPLSIATRGVFPGTIQLPDDGLPIILGPKCGLTGGYPMIASVIRADRPAAAQMSPGHRVILQMIDEAEAISVRSYRLRWYRSFIPDFRL